jgi:hypothetical protein
MNSFPSGDGPPGFPLLPPIDIQRGEKKSDGKGEELRSGSFCHFQIAEE